MCAMRVAAPIPGARVAVRGAQRRLPTDAVAGPQQRRAAVRCRVLTEGADLAGGTKAPAFALPEPLTGKTVALEELSADAKATLIMFLSVHCPYVKLLKSEIAAVAREYQARGVAVVAIGSNSSQTHPQDGPDGIAAECKELGYTFPYVFDASQDVARAYTAACTPEFYVFGPDLGLAYHGQFDSARPKSDAHPVTGADLRAALDAVLAGRPAPKSRASIGCNLKWHPGSEPEWFGTQQVKK